MTSTPREWIPSAATTKVGNHNLAGTFESYGRDVRILMVSFPVRTDTYQQWSSASEGKKVNSHRALSDCANEW